jgi:hypothetical protein
VVAERGTDMAIGVLLCKLQQVARASRATITCFSFYKKSGTTRVQCSSISFAPNAWTWWKGKRDPYPFTTVPAKSTRRLSNCETRV